MMLLYIAATLMFPIEFYATRIFEFDEGTSNTINVVVDALVGLLRCAIAVAIVHADITEVAKQAAEAQEWRRKAADTRLDAIQQFTRYIFHEARVPLQAVTLAVDELEEGLKEAMGHTGELRRRLRSRLGALEAGSSYEARGVS